MSLTITHLTPGAINYTVANNNLDAIKTAVDANTASGLPVALTMTGDTTATPAHVAASLLVLRGSPASGSLLTLPNITFAVFIKNETGVDIDVTRATSGTTDTLPDGYMRNYYHVP